METPSGPRGNRVLVLLVLPFYLAWSAMRGMANALIAAADRMAGLLARAMRAVADLLRPVAEWLMAFLRVVGRILAGIGRALAQLARFALRVLDATVGRVLRVLVDGVMRFGRALARAIALVIDWIWDPRSPIRIALLAMASAIRHVIIAIVRLGRAAADLAAAVGRAIGALVGPPLARAIAGVRDLLRGIARAVGTAIAAIRSIVGPVFAIAVEGAGTLLRGLARTIGQVAAPIIVAVRRLAADLKTAVSPLREAIAAAAREARRTVRQIVGLPETRPPDRPTRARNLPPGVSLRTGREEAQARPSAASRPGPATSRRSAVGPIAATTTIILLPLVIGYDLLDLSDGAVAIAIVLGVGFLVGLAHFRARGLDAVIGFGLGTAAVFLLQAMMAPLLHFTTDGSRIEGWLLSTAIGLSTFYVGALVGDVTSPPTAHPH